MSRSSGKVRIAQVTTVADTFHFLKGQMRALVDAGVEVHAISSPGAKLDRVVRETGAIGHGIELTRAVTPRRDARSIVEMATLLRSIGPDLVQAHTPKGGLAGMAGAALARVPVRIYHCHGLRFETMQGPMRRVIKSVETLTCRLGHEVWCDSFSVRERLLAEGMVQASVTRVHGGGSVDGIDTDHFSPIWRSEPERRVVRARFGIPESARVVGFLGRIVRDKGVEVLADAWARIRARDPDAWLLIAGSWEDADPPRSDVRPTLEADDRVVFTGYLEQPRDAYVAMDVLCVPTFREGIGLAFLEASSMELPVIGCAVTGVTDAVEDGVTGRLVPARDSVALESAIVGYLGDSALCAAHGRAGRERVIRLFSPSLVRRSVFDAYDALLRPHGKRLVLDDIGV